MGTTTTGEPPNALWEPGMNDRREAQRRNVVDTHLVTVDLAFQTGALLLDLSETGLGVQALSSAPAGDTTSLHFELPETGGRVEAVGRIAWTDSSGRLGIRFEDIAEASRVHLAQWLSRERRPLVAAGNNISLPSWPPAHMRDEIAALRRDLVTQKLEGDAALAFIVERTHSVTRATGAAIALEDNGAIVCRSSSGNAPGIGAHLDPNSGLSGECVRTAEIVRCEDTESDPRADRLVCRKLDLRSIIIVPIRIHGRTAGVLEAFSSRPHAFQSNDVLLLRRVTDLVAGITVRQLEPARFATDGPHAVMASTLLEPFMPEPSTEGNPAPLMMDDILALDMVEAAPAAAAEEFLHEILPPPVIAKPEAAVATERIPTTPLPAVEPKETERVTALPEIDRVVASSAAVIAEPERPTPMPPEKPEVERITAPPPAIEVERQARPAAKKPDMEWRTARTSAAASGPAMTRSPEPAFSRPVVESATAAAAATVAAMAPAKPAPAPIEEEEGQEEEFESRPAGKLGEALLGMGAQRPSPWKMRITGAGILAAVLVIGGWQAWRAIAPPRGTPMDAELNKAQAAAPASAPEYTAPVLPATTTSVPVPAAAAPGNATPGTAKPAAAKPAAAQPMAAQPAEVTTRVFKPAPPSTAAEESITLSRPEIAKVEEAPPALGLASRPVGESTAISNVLSVPVARPALKLDRPAVSQISGGKLLQRVDPSYPTAAMGMRGEVVLKATVGKDGKVRTVKIVSGHAVLAQAAAFAVKRWRYQPYVLNGVPIEVENTVVVTFKSPTR